MLRDEKCVAFELMELMLNSSFEDQGYFKCGGGGGVCFKGYEHFSCTVPSNRNSLGAVAAIQTVHVLIIV